MHRREEESSQYGSFPPGHYHSPIPSVENVREREDRIFGRSLDDIPGVDLNLEGQLALFDELRRYYPELPFKPHREPHLRYWFENPWYSYSDAIFLYCMIRHLVPQRVIEVGSGYSSCVILDTNELFFNNAIECVFIDPNPERLLSLMKRGDEHRITILRKDLQDVRSDFFLRLSRNDVLLVDSSHVAKVGSDVNYLIFEVLPRLNVGVHVHFHDIFYHFEYPKEWIYAGRFWNEAYLLRAFLQFNHAFRIRFFGSFLSQFHFERLKRGMPLCVRNPGGSLWLERVKA